MTATSVKALLDEYRQTGTVTSPSIVNALSSQVLGRPHALGYVPHKVGEIAGDAMVTAAGGKRTPPVRSQIPLAIPPPRGTVKPTTPPNSPRAFIDTLKAGPVQ